MKRVVVGLSGGVDSSVAAYLLKEQGYDVWGLFMINWHDTVGTLSGECPWEEDSLIAEIVARKLDIPFRVVDLSEEYRHRVVDYMFAEYGKGRTPNPDVLCNREIKFDVFLREAKRLGADYVATGHYCRRDEEEHDGVVYNRLLAGSDPGKDQSYFLCQLSQRQLDNILFPIGSLLKSDVRRIAEEQHLATAHRKDSQGICFVGKVDLPVFLQQKLKAKKGDIIEIDKHWKGYGKAADGAEAENGGTTADEVAGTAVRSTSPEETMRMAQTLAEPELAALATPIKYAPTDGTKAGGHNGAHFYTIGQRKGLNVGGKVEPLFVLATDTERNVIYAGQGQDHPGLYRKALHILPGEMHWIRPDRALATGTAERFSMRIRYRQPLQGGVLKVTGQGGYIIFDEPQRGITAGQFAAWYDGEELIGSGVIEK